jgi:pimeloyl-ACP methyl ester carboxylesterase
MATFVTVHGTFGGAFSWREFASLLSQPGHAVYTTTLTGLGERSHLISPEIDLSTHIQDTVNVLEYEDLHEVLLVGHSYGGAVIAGVAERVPERLAHLVYLDALILYDGERVRDMWAPEMMQYVAQLVQTQGEGYKIPSSLTAREGEETDPRYKDHPWKTWLQPVEVRNPAVAQILHTYVYCTREKENPLYEGIVRSAQRARELGWGYYEMDTDHGPWLAKPQELAELLWGLAAATTR